MNRNDSVGRFDRSTRRWIRDKRYVIFAGYERDPIDVNYVTRRICIPICLFVTRSSLGEGDILPKRDLWPPGFPHRDPPNVAVWPTYLQFMIASRVRLIRPCTQPRRFYTVATSRRQKEEGENIRRHSRASLISLLLSFSFFFLFSTSFSLHGTCHGLSAIPNRGSRGW